MRISGARSYDAHRSGRHEANVTHLCQRERVRGNVRRCEVHHLAARYKTCKTQPGPHTKRDSEKGSTRLAKATLELNAAVDGTTKLELHQAHATRVARRRNASQRVSESANQHVVAAQSGCS